MGEETIILNKTEPTVTVEYTLTKSEKFGKEEIVIKLQGNISQEQVDKQVTMAKAAALKAIQPGV